MVIPEHRIPKEEEEEEAEELPFSFSAMTPAGTSNPSLWNPVLKPDTTRESTR
jgi:hypothetical protein